MAHLGMLEQKLNSDPAFRAEFLRDPAGVLLREGITLFPKQQRALQESVTRLQAGRGAAGEGIQISPQPTIGSKISFDQH